MDVSIYLAIIYFLHLLGMFFAFLAVGLFFNYLYLFRNHLSYPALLNAIGIFLGALSVFVTFTATLGGYFDFTENIVLVLITRVILLAGFVCLAVSGYLALKFERKKR